MIHPIPYAEKLLVFPQPEESVWYEQVKANLITVGYITSQRVLRKIGICYSPLAGRFSGRKASVRHTQDQQDGTQARKQEFPPFLT